MTWKTALLSLALVAVGCAAHPLGDDWEQLSDPQRDERAVAVLRGLFEGGTDGSGAAFRDREVLEADAQRLRYLLLDEPDAKPSTLAWREIEAVEGQPLTTLPSRPETLFVYLKPQAGRGVHDRVTPVLASAGLARAYLLLRSRPRWSRSRMVLALDHLRARGGVAPVASGQAPAAPAEPAPAAAEPAPAAAEPAPTAPAEPAPTPPADPAPTATEPEPVGPAPARSMDDLEDKLRRLREWRDGGLITEEEYQAKKQDLLRRL